LLALPPGCGQSALVSSGGTVTVTDPSSASTLAPDSMRDRIGTRLPTVGVLAPPLPPNTPHPDKPIANATTSGRASERCEFESFIQASSGKRGYCAAG
jgi:hypothetical protein